MLSKFFKFSSKSDPFFLFPSQIAGFLSSKMKNEKIIKKSKQKTKINKPELIRLEIDYSLIKKLKKLELILVEESVTDFFISSSCTTGTSNEEAKLQIEDERKLAHPSFA